MASDIAIAMSDTIYHRASLTSDIKLWLRELRQNTVSYSDNASKKTKSDCQRIIVKNSKAFLINDVRSLKKINRYSFDLNNLIHSDSNKRYGNCKLNIHKITPEEYRRFHEINGHDAVAKPQPTVEPIYENIWEYKSRLEKTISIESNCDNTSVQTILNQIDNAIDPLYYERFCDTDKNMDISHVNLNTNINDIKTWKKYPTPGDGLVNRNSQMVVDELKSLNSTNQIYHNITDVLLKTDCATGSVKEQTLPKKPIAAPRTAPKKTQHIYENVPIVNKPKVPPKINVNNVPVNDIKLCEKDRHSEKREDASVDSDVPTHLLNVTNNLSSFKPNNIKYAKEVEVEFQRPMSICVDTLVSEYDIVCLTEKVTPRKSSITSNVLNWACDLFDNYESEPDCNRMEETPFPEEPKETTDITPEDNNTLQIHLRNPKFRFSDRKIVKSANISDIDIKLGKIDENNLSTSSNLVIKKQGELENIKVVIENKKCKYWKKPYGVLTNRALWMFKYKKDFENMKMGIKGPVDSVNIDLQKSSTKLEHHHKKSTLVVSDENMTQMYFPHDYSEWRTDIEEVITTLQTALNMVPSISTEDLDKPASPSREQTKIKNKLKHFFGGPRTSVEALAKRGIYRDEPIFGSYLDTICTSQPRPKVPEFVKLCIKSIEPYMNTDGLYRASGNLSQVQKIRLQVDQNDFENVDAEKTDIHVLTGALKLFFRELKVSLIPNNEYEQCIEACNQEKSRQAQALSAIVNRLSPAHRDTLEHLIKHLIDVSKRESENRMDVSNLATVWAPNILQGTLNSVKHDMLYHCTMQMRVVETMLVEYHVVFGIKNKHSPK